MSIVRITPQELFARRERGEAFLIVDVRTPAEYRACHIEGAKLYPLTEVNSEIVERDRSQINQGNCHICVTCETGNRAQKACQTILNQLPNVILLEGGTTAWASAGFPVIRGRAMISLMRQMRIFAGSLVLLGLVIGYWWHPIGFLLAGFIGGGLVFSGVTDLCGMTMFLARMPWNK